MDKTVKFENIAEKEASDDLSVTRSAYHIISKISYFIGVEKRINAFASMSTGLLN